MKPISAYFELLDEQIQLPLEGINHPVVLKYIGYLQSQPTLYCGFDILEPEMGKNNGSYKGVQYFETKFVNSGLFIPLYKINNELSAALMGVSQKTKPQIDTEEVEKLRVDLDTHKTQVEVLKTEKEHLLEVIDKNQVLINDFEGMMNIVEPKLSDFITRIRVLEQENRDLKTQIRDNVDIEFQEKDFDMDFDENLTPVKL